MAGGNSHDRAMSKAADGKAAKTQKAPKPMSSIPTQKPEPPEQKPFRWDITLALAVAAMTIWLVLSPPSTKRGLIFWLVVMFGLSIYPVLHLADWMNGKKWLKAKVRESVVKLGLVCVWALCVLFLGSRLWAQIEPPLRPSISFNAVITPAYTDGSTEFGIKWREGSSSVRLIVTDLTDFPLHSFDLTVKVLDKTGDTLVGMGEASDFGCKFHGPRWPDMSLNLHGQNGKDYRLPMPDSELSFGGEWKASCPMLPAGLPLKLVVAVSNEKKWKEPEKLRLVGSYEVVSDNGTRAVGFDKIIDIAR